MLVLDETGNVDYAKMRQFMYDKTLKEYSRLGFSFHEITQSDAAAADKWNQSDPKKKVRWKWEKQYAIYKKQHPERFDIAIEYEGDLCALCYGRIEGNGLVLSIDFLERNSLIRPKADNDKYIKIFGIVYFAAIVYAEPFGIEEFQIQNPDGDLIEYYSGYGFLTAEKIGNKVLYLSKKIKP